MLARTLLESPGNTPGSLPGGCALAEMLVSMAAMPIPESVVTCTRLVYEKMGAKLTPEGPSGSLIVGGLTKREVAYAWGVVRLVASLSASYSYCLQVLLNGRAVMVKWQSHGLAQRKIVHTLPSRSGSADDLDTAWAQQHAAAD